MTTLHTINRVSALASCLEIASDDDTILLIEDGVYAATQPQPRALLAIDIDVQARGISSRLTEETTVVDYAKFVELTVQLNPIVTWC